MLDTAEKDEIVRFIMANNKRKHLALEVISIQDSLFNRLRTDFSIALETRIRQIASDRDSSQWRSINFVESTNKKYDFGLEKTNWGGKIKVLLSPFQRKPTNFGIGIYCTSPDLQHQASSAFRLFRGRKEREEPQSDLWPYCFKVKSEYSDWLNASKFGKLFIGDEALDYLSGELGALAIDSEKIIDDLLPQ